MELKALIFDVDGTLAETEEGHRLAFNTAFKKFGFDWQWNPSVYQELLQVTGGKERMRYYVGTSFPEEVERFEQCIVELHKLKQEHYAEIIRGGEIQLRPGIKRLIFEARKADLKLGIATTSTM
ncbi:MAG: HAD hydrolase-like protein, partial [Desulfobulbia bacterium]